MIFGRRNSRGGPWLRARGFTLVEVLVAVMLVSVGIITVMSFALITTREFSRSKTVSMATTLARSELDSLRAVPYDDLVLGSATRSVKIGSIDLDVTRVVAKTAPNLKSITVSIVGPDSKEYQRYSTYVYNYVSP